MTLLLRAMVDILIFCSLGIFRSFTGSLLLFHSRDTFCLCSLIPGTLVSITTLVCGVTCVCLFTFTFLFCIFDGSHIILEQIYDIFPFLSRLLKSVEIQNWKPELHLCNDLKNQVHVTPAAIPRGPYSPQL